jgi:hypothetical protein
MQQLLCEPEDRLGSQLTASVSRPDSMIVQARRSAFIPTASSSGSVDGADLIKVIFPRKKYPSALILKSLRCIPGSEELIG